MAVASGFKMSSSFFSDAYQNIQNPQVIINGTGPLPPSDTSGLPYGMNAIADARINYNSTLLGDLTPYAYGKPGRLSSQTAYMAVPHMIQKVVPVLSIPSAQFPGNQVTKLYHGISDGDIAFTININRRNIDEIEVFDKVGALRAIDPFVNLATVNYLLAGIQMYSDISGADKWHQFIRDIGMYKSPDTVNRVYKIWDILRIVRDVFIPFGIPRGSEMQGGQTQGTNANNVFPVDHVTSLLLDGKCINIINIWRKHEVSAGDDLILILKKIKPHAYNLSRDTNTSNWQVFGDMPNNAEAHKENSTIQVDLNKRKEEGVWQIVPFVFDWASDGSDKWLSSILPNEDEYDYRENGYWHIARALQMAGKDPHEVGDTYSDATRYRKTGELMEVAFQPVFVEKLPDGSNHPEYRKTDENDARDRKKELENKLLAPLSSFAGVGPSSTAWEKYLQTSHSEYERQHGENAKHGVMGFFSGSMQSVGGRKRPFSTFLSAHVGSSEALGSTLLNHIVEEGNEELSQQMRMEGQGDMGGVIHSGDETAAGSTPSMDAAVSSGRTSASAHANANTAAVVPAGKTVSVSKKSKKTTSSSSTASAAASATLVDKSLSLPAGSSASSHAQKAAAAAQQNMPSLSGSFIENSGLQHITDAHHQQGPDGPSSSSVRGSFRASLLSATTNSSTQQNKD